MRIHERLCLFLLLSVVLVASSCDDTDTFTFENATTERVAIFFSDDEEPVVILAPNQTKNITILEQEWTGRLLARNNLGEVVFDAHIPLKQLKQEQKVTIK